MYQESGSQQDSEALTRAVALRFIGLLTAVTKPDATAPAAIQAHGCISKAQQDKLVQGISTLQEGLCKRDVEVPLKPFSLMHAKH